jgi:type II secretory pathway pseudopilin PulG
MLLTVYSIADSGYSGKSIMMKKHSNKQKFTLIEMIAVVAIASILIAVFVPAFNKMMFGSKVDQAASNFKLGLEVAQSRAIASRKYVAMIIPLKIDDSNLKTNMKKYCMGGYRLAYVKKSGSEYKFVSWVPDSSWRNPDDGARLVRIDTGKNWNSDVTDLANDKLPQDASKLSDYFDFAISKNSGDKNPVDVSDIPSAADGDEEEDIRTWDDINRQAVIFSPYGGVMNSSDDLKPLRFYFTETKVDGNSGAVQYPNPDNILQLSLNPLTGRVTYLSED